jgi:hypothetical protein
MFVYSNSLLQLNASSRSGALIMESAIAIVTIAVLRLIRGLLTDEQLDTI